MEEDENVSAEPIDETQSPFVGREPFIAPKLMFVKPELVHQGSLADVTGAFFGSFSV